MQEFKPVKNRVEIKNKKGHRFIKNVCNKIEEIIGWDILEGRKAEVNWENYCVLDLEVETKHPLNIAHMLKLNRYGIVLLPAGEYDGTFTYKGAKLAAFSLRSD